MKNGTIGILRVLAVLALVAAVFVWTACDTTTNPKSKTLTYSGISEDGEEYFLTIYEGNRYALVKGLYTNKGTYKKTGDTYNLVPEVGESFTVKVSPQGITGMKGEITYNNGICEQAPENMQPTGYGVTSDDNDGDDLPLIYLTEYEGRIVIEADNDLVGTTLREAPN